ncbi:meiotic recombination, partial [Coemansia sp. RSA 2603]
HQCQLDPEYNHQKSFYVTQPGSSVATSLSVGEAVAKHVAVLHIHKRNFKIEKIRLKNVRPFVIDDVTLAAVPSLSPQSTEDEIVEFLRTRVEAMILTAQRQYNEQLDSGDPVIDPALGLQPKPLIRVRVDYSGGFESFHPQRFGLLFVDRVANPRDIVYFYRKARAADQRHNSSTSSSSAAGVSQAAAGAISQEAGAAVPAPVDAVHVESLIGEFIDDSSMQMLVDLELAEAIRLFVQKGDNDAIAQSLQSTIADTKKHILAEATTSAIDEKALDERISQARMLRRQKAAEDGKGSAERPSMSVSATSVTLATKSTAINTTDRNAIRQFERVAAQAAASSRNVSQGGIDENDDDEGDISNSDKDDPEDD